MRWALVALSVAACKGSDPAPAPAPAATSIDDKCITALQKAPAQLSARYVDSLFAACKPCGDWTPILDWNRLPADGGPTRDAIDRAMAGCHAYCEPNAKQRFLGTLDAARGVDSRMPWRLLGEACKEQVSAVPDARYLTAPFFALDRIARAASATPAGAAALAKIDLPLPAIGVSGTGLELPTAPVTSPNVPVDSVTIAAQSVSVGKLPRGKLGATGVTVEHAGEYPGRLLLDSQNETLDSVLAQTGATSFTVLAPRNLAAARIASIASSAPEGTTLFLAVAAPGAPAGWTLPGVVPIALMAPHVKPLGEELGKPRPAPADSKPVIAFSLGASADAAIAEVKKHTAPEYQASHVAITVGDGATVASLAQLLGALAYFQVPAVSFAQ